MRERLMGTAVVGRDGDGRDRGQVRWGESRPGLAVVKSALTSQKLAASRGMASPPGGWGLGVEKACAQ